MTPPTIVHSEVDAAIERAQAALLAAQAPDGHWVGELEADSTITSEYLLLCHMLDRVDRDREAKMVKYLRERQLPDGGWSLYEGGPPNISATIKAYFAMKVAGVSMDDPAMEQARARIRDWGGPVEANVFTKILLALFGEYDWRGVPSMPVEIMLLPRWSYFNLLEVSYWSRTVIVPLLILMDSKPVKRLPDSCRLDELWPVPREQASLRLKRIPRPFSPKRFIWKNLFIGVDDALKGWERLGPRPFRGRALEAARRDLFFAINFNHHYAQPVALAHRDVTSGRLGDLTFATWRFGRPSSLMASSSRRSPRSRRPAIEKAAARGTSSRSGSAEAKSSRT